MRLLYEAGVTLKLKHASLFADTIDYLGHVIRPGCLELTEHATDAVAKLDHSTTQNELR